MMLRYKAWQARRRHRSHAAPDPSCRLCVPYRFLYEPVRIDGLSKPDLSDEARLLHALGAIDLFPEEDR